MPQLVASPTLIVVPGNKRIEEHVGRVNTGESDLSIAKMTSPPGWEGQCVVTNPGERVRYSTPEGAEYVAVCLPAFAPDTVHREE